MKGLKVLGEGFSNGYDNKKIFIANSKYNLATFLSPCPIFQRANKETIVPQ